MKRGSGSKKSPTQKRSRAAPPTLTLRDRNRATLARQMLLARDKASVTDVLTRLAGLQAQWPAPPYTGLWTRLAKFARADLAGPLARHEFVRATAMRGTLHVVTAEDYARFRPLLEPMLQRGYASIASTRGRGIDPVAVAAEARALLTDGPRTMEEIRQHLARQHPRVDARIMGYAVRMYLPLVQVPDDSCAWGFPPEPAFALADAWIGRAFAAEAADACELVRRHLAAFGPAAARDVQTWSGVRGLGEALETLRPELRVFIDEAGRELFDLPDAPRPGGDTEAPVRFLPEFDNLLLAHHDRTRFVPAAFRAGVFKAGLQVAATFLVDGFVRGAWKLERKKSAATLVLTPFATLTKSDRAALEDEGAKLARFLAPDASARAIRWENP